MSSKKYDVVGLGNSLVDVFANVDEAFITQQALAKGSMRLIDAAEAVRLYGLMPQGTEMSGGSGANTIAAMASLGSKVAFIGRVGQDQLGDVFKHDIEALGVSFVCNSRDTTEPTGRCLVLVTPDAERTMNTALGCNVNFSPADLSAEVIAQSRVLYMEGYLFDKPQAKAAFIEAAAIARANGTEVALTLSDSFCVDRHRDDFLKLLESVDILFANEKEINSLYQTENFEEAAAKVRQVCKLAVLTRSAKGAVIQTATDSVVVLAEPVAQVVDLTGAGDAYAGGFLHGYTRGLPLAECGRLGALSAAEIISHFGTRPLIKLSDYVAGKRAA